MKRDKIPFPPEAATEDAQRNWEVSKLQHEVADLRSWIRRFGGTLGLVTAILSVIITFKSCSESRVNQTLSETKKERAEIDAIKAEDKKVLADSELKKAQVEKGKAESQMADALKTKDAATKETITAQTTKAEAEASVATAQTELRETEKALAERKKELKGISTQGVTDLTNLLEMLRPVVATTKDQRVRSAFSFVQDSLRTYEAKSKEVGDIASETRVGPAIVFVNLRIPQTDAEAARVLSHVTDFLKKQNFAVKENQRSRNPPSVTEIRYVHYPDDKEGAQALMKLLQDRFKIAKVRISYVNIDGGQKIAKGAFEVSFAPGALKEVAISPSAADESATP